MLKVVQNKWIYSWISRVTSTRELSTKPLAAIMLYQGSMTRVWMIEDKCICEFLSREKQFVINEVFALVKPPIL